MANPFDVFDDQPVTVKPSATAEGNPFDAFDPPTPQSPVKGVLANAKGDSDLTAAGKNVATGAIKGAAGVVGMPGNLRELADMAVTAPEAWLTGRSVSDVLAERRAAAKEAEASTALGRFRRDYTSTDLLPTGQEVAKPILERTGEYAPTSTAGRVAQAGVEMAAGSLGLGSGAVSKGVSGLSALGASAAAAPGAAGFGAMSQAATEAGYGPVGSIAAGLAGNLAGAGAAGLTRNVAGRTADYLRPMASEIPILRSTRFGKEAVPSAARDLMRDTASDPDAALAALNREPARIIPDDALPPGMRGDANPKATTGQITGDMGLLDMERVARTVDDQFREAWLNRRSDQNAARVAALEGIQPAGAPMAVSARLRENMRLLNDTLDTQELVARTQAANAANRIGDFRSTEAVGEAFRGQLSSARSAAYEIENRLYRELNRYRDMTLPTDPLRQRLVDVYGSLTEPAKLGVPSLEAKLAGLAAGYKPSMPFGDLLDLKSRVAAAMRALRPDPNAQEAYGRLSQIRDALEETMTEAVDRTVANETRAVAEGTLREAETLQAALNRLQAEADAWLAGRAAVGSDAGAVGGGGGGGAGPAGLGGRGTVSAAPGPQGAGGGRSGAGPNAGGAPEVPFSAEARDVQRRANAATVYRKETWDRNRFVGPVTAPGQTAGDFKMADRAVPDKVLAGGSEGIRAFRAALPPEHADDAIRDAVAHAYRRDVMRNGEVDPKAHERWVNQHREALREVPQLADEFQTAAGAAQAVADVAALRKNVLDDFEKSALGKIMNAADANEVQRRVAGLLGAPDVGRQLRNLKAEIGNDPVAMEGLRKAIVDHMAEKVVGVTEAGTSGINQVGNANLHNFLRKNREALKEVFDPAQVDTMLAVAADLSRANRSITAVQLPATPNTARDLKEVLSQTSRPRPSLFGEIVTAAAAGNWIFGWPAAIGMGTAAWARGTAAAFREAGITKASQLVKEALLDPDLAKELLRPPPGKNAPPPRALITKLTQRSLMDPGQIGPTAPVEKEN